MPFEEDDELPNIVKNAGLKNVSSKKSIFDNLPKKPTQQDLDKRAQNIEDKDMGYKQRVSDLAIKFKKLSEDKTLSVNRKLFANEIEREILSEMINLAIEINNDPEEKNDGMGSLSWITLLFKTSLAQRDRINKLEFDLLQMEKNKISNLSELITKEIEKALDKKKNSE